MSKDNEKNESKWIFTFANEPSKEAIQAYSEAVSRIILKHIQKEARDSTP